MTVFHTLCIHNLLHSIYLDNEDNESLWKIPQLILISPEFIFIVSVLKIHIVFRIFMAGDKMFVLTGKILNISGHPSCCEEQDYQKPFFIIYRNLLKDIILILLRQ